MKFNKGDLQAVLSGASKDSSRYNLNGVYVEAGSMVTTDVHRLHRVTIESEDDAPEFEPFILSRVSADRFAKSMPAKSEATVASACEGNESATLETSDGQSFKGETITGEFPNYKQVLPSGEPVHTVRLNAQYLKELCDAVIKAEKGLAVIGGKTEKGSHDRAVFVDIEFLEDLTPVRFAGAAKRFDGVIMPVRTK